MRLAYISLEVPVNKTTKGALAAAGAAALLLGGAGTVAYWTATADVAGGTIVAGELALDPLTCGDWLYDADEDDPSVAYEAGDVLVPGDTLTKDCSYTLTATGEHMRGTIVADAVDVTGDLAAALDVEATFTVDDVVQTEFTEADDQSTVDVTVSVTFTDPGIEDNSTQGLQAVLDSISVTAQQIHD